MIKSHLYIILTLFSLCSYSAYSQINCITDPPLPPLLTSVSVKSETGITELNWTSSPSSDVAAYLIYVYHDENGVPRGDIIDTIWDPAATSYNYSSTAYNYFSLSYVITAIRLPRCSSPFSNVLNSIFAEVHIDTCNKKIILSWNSYPSLPKKVTDYSILVSVNDGSFSETGRVSSEENSFTLNDFTTDAEYCFVVRANLEGGTSSTSNKTCQTTMMQRPPQWINADYATVNTEKTISLSFTFDPASEISLFSLERKSGSSGSYEQIEQPESDNGLVKYTDIEADINNVNYYRLSAINNCKLPVVVSNISSNIVLSLQRSDNDIRLTWNPYRNWSGNVSAYTVFLNTGNGFEEKEVIQPSDTLFSIDYSEIMYEISGNEVCFYITASETANQHGITGESRSNIKCINATETITVPTVFTPNNDLLNDFFKPVLSFTPVDYHLVVSDRQGNLLFETKDHLAQWDGSHNGKSLPQGVYLWFLKLRSPSGKIITRTGTITITFNR